MSDSHPNPDDDPPYAGRGAFWLAAGNSLPGELEPRAGLPLLDGGAMLGEFHDADELGEPAFVCRRPDGAGSTLKEVVALAGKVPTRKELGAQERVLLDALLEADDLRADQREAFGDMRAAIDAQFGRYLSLTERQRAWVLSECEERGISLQTPAQRNANVPRGREVAPAWGQGQLPLAPPGRAAVAKAVVREALPDASSLVQAGAAADLETFMREERGARATVAAGSPPARSRPAILPAAPVVADVTLTAAGATLFLDAGGAGPAKTDAPIAAKELRDSILRSAKATALQARKPVRIVDDAGTELAQIDARGMLHPPAAEPATPPGGGSGARRRRPAASPR